MTKETAIKLFNEQRIRMQWDKTKEKWYFSIVDVVGVLTESKTPNNYWKVLKNRLKKEGSELVTNCNQLKMQSSDGKYYNTDVADTRKGGNVAKAARLKLENTTGKKVVTKLNSKYLDDSMLESGNE